VTTILALQSVTLIAPLLFGALALRIAARLRDSDSRRATWLLTGICFSVFGANGALAAGFSNWAFAAGPGSTAWNLWLVWLPSGNYSRLLTVLAFAGALLAMCLRARSAAALVRPAVVATGLALVAGVGLGLAEGTAGSGVHIPRYAVINAVLVVLLLGALLAAAATDATDQILWAAVALYALKNALTVILLTTVAWVEHVRQVPPETLFAMHLVAWAAMILLALRRYRLATRGRYVPAIFERSPVRRRVMV
jgi:hypothetical protein